MSGLSEAERGALEVALNTGETLVVVLPGGPLASAVEAILIAHDAERDALAARVEAEIAQMESEPPLVLIGQVAQRVRAAFASPDPREHGTGGGDE